ncbi:MAG: hypothetical protein RIG84_00045 [Roseovarius sp.]
MGLATTLSAQEAPDTTTPDAPALRRADVIDAGAFHTCVLTQRVFCWGANTSGQLGDGTTQNRAAPVLVTGLGRDVVQITTGANHTCALRSNGRALCWGSNTFGQLGDRTTTSSSTPVLVRGLTSIGRIVAGENHTCAFDSSRAKVFCWGANFKGQLGDGTTQNSLVPVRVKRIDLLNSTLDGGLVSTGEHTCAHHNSGRSVCWGNNDSGQLGNGTTDNSSLPVTARRMNQAILATGGQHSCGMKALRNNKVFCWGLNATGQLGDGTTTNRALAVPVKRLGRSMVIGLAAGSAHTCALKMNERVVCWGWNSSGQLGNDTISQSLFPVRARGIPRPVQIAAGNVHTCAVTLTGRAYCWGNNDFGQVGSGDFDTRRYLSPVRVPGFGS